MKAPELAPVQTVDFRFIYDKIIQRGESQISADKSLRRYQNFLIFLTPTNGFFRQNMAFEIHF